MCKRKQQQCLGHMLGQHFSCFLCNILEIYFWPESHTFLDSIALESLPAGAWLQEGCVHCISRNSSNGTMANSAGEIYGSMNKCWKSIQNFICAFWTLIHQWAFLQSSAHPNKNVVQGTKYSAKIGYDTHSLTCVDCRKTFKSAKNLWTWCLAIGNVAQTHYFKDTPWHICGSFSNKDIYVPQNPYCFQTFFTLHYFDLTL